MRVHLERSRSELYGWDFLLPLLSVHTALANDPKRLVWFVTWVIYLLYVLMTHATHLILGHFFPHKPIASTQEWTKTSWMVKS